jgi:mono/diheme cytochrome c family protein
MMRTEIHALGIALATALAVPVMAPAQDVGQMEFMDSCAQCHGPAGMGDGPLSGYLNTQLPDLTAIQSNNGGVFPVTAIYHTIDGTTTSGAHGSSDMPAWGSRFQVRGAQVANPEFSTEEAEVYARFRILALIEYLASIQQN